jgi:hypothetical protein
VPDTEENKSEGTRVDAEELVNVRRAPEEAATPEEAAAAAEELSEPDRATDFCAVALLAQAIGAT